jgi:NADH:ubiquinone oxidoreductase subunit 2 (subunit N)
VIRAVYWSKDPPELSPIAVPLALRIPIYVCMAGLLYLGLFPDAVLGMATDAVKVWFGH